MSQITICNKALALLGANHITSLADDTLEAKALANVYDQSLRSILSECGWSFALKRADLNRLEEKPIWGEGNYYQLPSDYIRIFETSRPYAKWRIEGDRILTKAESFSILYTYFCMDDSKYTPSFTDAFACKLASDVCYEITNNSNRQTELLTMYKSEFLPIARSMNSRDRTPDEVTDDHWVNGIYWG